ncbi:unnamed protein product [Notodromas monacha]|uniref:Uncharacterized protein n=1 Tax=Notodromas monacha TaxID=399045 RepID=A0A7R9BIX9_9CRUS|nr:unnamed protein product [Notodromas monacha]CAG0916060.1 unnamed protein product [Notodromas monacha]
MSRNNALWPSALLCFIALSFMMPYVKFSEYGSVWKPGVLENLVMKLWGCEKPGGEVSTHEDPVSDDAEAETGNEGPGSNDEPVADHDPVKNTENEAKKRKRDLEAALDDMLKLDMKLDGLEDTWKEMRQRTHNRVLNAYKKLKQLRSELYDNRAEVVGNISAAVLRRASVPGQIERLKTQQGFLHASLDDLRQAKEAYFERNDVELGEFETQFQELQAGLGVAIDRVEGIESTLEDIQRNLTWPQHQIQFALAEMRQNEIVEEESASGCRDKRKKLDATESRTDNNGKKCDGQSDKSENSFLLHLDDEPGTITADGSMFESSENPKASKDSVADSQRLMKSSIFKNLWKVPDEEVDPSEHLKLDGFFPCSKKTCSSEVVTSASADIKKVFDNAKILKHDAAAVLEKIGDISKCAADLISLKWNILKVQAEAPADPSDKLIGLPGMIFTATSLNFQANAVKDLEESLTELRRGALVEKSKLSEMLDEVSETLEDLDKVQEDEVEVLGIIEERRGVRKKITEFYRMVEDYFCMKPAANASVEVSKSSKGGNVTVKADANANAALLEECSLQDASGKAAEYADCLARYMLRVKQMEIDFANFKEDMSHALALKSEYGVLRADAVTANTELINALRMLRMISSTFGGNLKRLSSVSSGILAALTDISDEIKEHHRKRDESLWKIFKGVEDLMTRLGDHLGFATRAERIKTGIEMASKRAEDLCSRFNCQMTETAAQTAALKRKESELRSSEASSPVEDPDSPSEGSSFPDLSNPEELKKILVALGLILFLILLFRALMGPGKSQRDPRAALTPASIVEMFPDQESIYDFSLAKGLILCRLLCPRCGVGNLILPQPSGSVMSLGQRECSECGLMVPVTENTVYSWNPQASPLIVLLVMWAWSHKKTMTQARYEIEMAMGDPPSQDIVESLYMMCKAIAERFLKLCPKRTTEGHYSKLHRFECCDDYVLGGDQEVVELYMDYALPNGDAVFLAKERGSDRAMMRSTSCIGPDTLDAFVNQFVQPGSIVIHPPVDGSEVSIDGYETFAFDPSESACNVTTRQGRTVNAHLKSVLRLWEQMVPEMTNDVTDELHLPVILIQTVWYKYFGCEVGYDPFNSFVEQAANAFSQWAVQWSTEAYPANAEGGDPRKRSRVSPGFQGDTPCVEESSGEDGKLNEPVRLSVNDCVRFRQGFGESPSPHTPGNGEMLHVTREAIAQPRSVPGVRFGASSGLCRRIS